MFGRSLPLGLLNNVCCCALIRHRDYHHVKEIIGSHYLAVDEGVRAVLDLDADDVDCVNAKACFLMLSSK